jgi:hypothetical protein
MQQGLCAGGPLPIHPLYLRCLSAIRGASVWASLGAKRGWFMEQPTRGISLRLPPLAVPNAGGMPRGAGCKPHRCVGPMARSTWGREMGGCWRFPRKGRCSGKHTWEEPWKLRPLLRPMVRSMWQPRGDGSMRLRRFSLGSRTATPTPAAH